MTVFLFNTTRLNIEKPDLFADIVSLLVIVCVAVALVRLYKSYRAQQIIRGMLPGILMLLAAVILKAADDIYTLPWVIRYLVMNVIIAVGGAYVGITFIGLIRKLYISSSMDGLTGCFNKDCFQNFLRVELARSKYKRQGLSLLYIDVDNFKMVNDSAGHIVGDVLLRELAKTIQENVRLSDAVVRWGGDEFVAVLPGSDGAKAREVADRISASVGVKFENYYGLMISVSIGIAIFPEDARTPEELLKVADERMYEVKHTKKTSNPGKRATDPDQPGC